MPARGQWVKQSKARVGDVLHDVLNSSAAVEDEMMCFEDNISRSYFSIQDIHPPSPDK